MEQLLTLASFGRVVGSHVSGRALVVLVDEVLQGQLGVEYATVLSFFDGDVVQEPARSANELAVRALCDLEQFFLDVELVAEPLASEVLLQLALEDQVKDSFLRLHPRYLQQELGLLRELVTATVRLNHLENVRVERVIQMLDRFDLVVGLLRLADHCVGVLVL